MILQCKFLLFGNLFMFFNNLLNSLIFLFQFTHFSYKFRMDLLLILNQPILYCLNQPRKSLLRPSFPHDNFFKRSRKQTKPLILIRIRLNFSLTCSHRFILKLPHSFLNHHIHILVEHIILLLLLIRSLTYILPFPLRRNHKIVRPFCRS